MNRKMKVIGILVVVLLLVPCMSLIAGGQKESSSSSSSSSDSFTPPEVNPGGWIHFKTFTYNGQTISLYTNVNGTSTKTVTTDANGSTTEILNK